MPKNTLENYQLAPTKCATCNAGWKVLTFEDCNYTVSQAFEQIKLVVSERIELSSPAYETRVLPLN